MARTRKLSLGTKKRSHAYAQVAFKTGARCLGATAGPHIEKPAAPLYFAGHGNNAGHAGHAGRLATTSLLRNGLCLEAKLQKGLAGASVAVLEETDSHQLYVAAFCRPQFSCSECIQQKEPQRVSFGILLVLDHPSHEESSTSSSKGPTCNMCRVHTPPMLRFLVQITPSPRPGPSQTAQ